MNQIQQKGQIALIVLLIASVVLTLGLSLSRSTVVDTKIDTDEELLKQAFNAAESGIEYYVKTGKKDYVAPDNNSSAQISVRSIGDTSINYEEMTPRNDVMYFWLVGHNGDGTINYSDYYQGSAVDVCTNAAFNGALKFDLFYRNGGQYSVQRSGVNFGANIVNNYVALASATPPVTSGCTGINLSIPAGSTPLLLAVTPLNASAYININGNGGESFPIQGEEINSLGRAGQVGATVGVNREVRVINRYKVPAFMLEAITSTGNVLSN